MTNRDQQYCPTCGAGQVPDAYFCGNCGTSFQPAEPVGAPPAPVSPYEPPPYQPAEPAYPYQDDYAYEQAPPGGPASYEGYSDYPDDSPPGPLQMDHERSTSFLPEPVPGAEVEDPPGSDENRTVSRQRGTAPMLAFAGILILAVTAASPTLLAADDSDGEDEATPAADVNPVDVADDEVLLQAADQVPEGAFFPDATLDLARAEDEETDFADLVLRVVSLPDHARVREEANASLSELAVTGTDPGVYGGQRRTGVCDRDALAALVTGEGEDEGGDDDEGSTEGDEPQPAEPAVEELATALELDSPDELQPYLDDLTAVRLRHDTRVTQHNLVDGTVVPTQTILQAGTGVLVDETGEAKLSCNGANPLSTPAPLQDGGDDAEGVLELDQVAANPTAAWERLDPSRVVTVEPGTEPQEHVLFADIDTTDLVERPVGTNGSRDMGPGDFVATLEWDSPADLDVSVVDANGAMISSQLPEPPDSAGRLAEDANALCKDNLVGQEEISWPDGDAPEGDYLVLVTGHAVGEGPSDNEGVGYEDDCGGDRAEFTLTIRLYGQEPLVHEDSVADKETKDYTVTVGELPDEASDDDASDDGDSTDETDASDDG